ncbi:LytR/AlgR family response regulator transcription factor [Salinimicrobium flavum]|uniref:LytR/AlgR family response regulator transcription factor n=1 Tax=Salinimicrobium flavum TaxID=1737065 RepID=A0ABW5IXV4_9FLAO
MKTLIIEDEALAADSLEAQIKDLRPGTEVLGKIGSVEEAVEWFGENLPPDLLFCDIHLSDGSCFEIFKQVDVKCPVIFTTAYNEYAIEAFKVNSVDYLLKPVKKDELAFAIMKYEDHKSGSLDGEMENLKELLRHFPASTGNKKKSRFMVKSGQTIKAINGEAVAYFLAEEGVVLLVTFEGKRYIINYTLDQLEELVDEEMFFRVNRQLIANIGSIKEVHPYFKGRLHLTLEPGVAGEQIISSSKASSFKAWLDL